jgi:L-ascorbate metabolism protein UlaG (beta-lactamase superfamily)
MRLRLLRHATLELEYRGRRLLVDPMLSEAGGDGSRRQRGKHGEDPDGSPPARSGPVSGFVLRAPDEPSLHIAGDTVWCPDVASVLAEHRPAVIVVNAGAAQFLTGGPITMDAPDVLKVAAGAPSARLVAVHFEAVNHCLLRRAELRAAADTAGVGSRILVPADGEALA